MPTGSIPPYFTSGAFSRAHHALVVKLDQAPTSHAMDKVVNDEVQRVRDELGSRTISTAKIGELLLILLHCAMIRQEASADLDFALIHGLKLAEGGKTLRDRRIGYLFLCERLPLGHELNLLFINTIRKDLSSATPAHALLGLSAVASVPSRELAPAAVPILTSRALLKHKIPAIRKATLHALRALSLQGNATATDGMAASTTSTASASSFPLASDRLGRLLSSEQDQGVLSAILKLIMIAHQRDMTYCTPRSLWISAVLQAAELFPPLPSQMTLDCLALLELLLHSAPNDPDQRAVGDFVSRYLATISDMKGWNGAFVIRACAFISTLPKRSTESLLNAVLRILSRVMSTSRASGSQQSTQILTANDHCVVLRCFRLLPRSVIETRLDEAEMKVLMAGVDHGDQMIRCQTLRLLSSLDPNLTSLSITHQLDRLRAQSSLATLRQRQTVASRALEVAIVDTEPPERDGYLFAQRCVDISLALEAPKRRGKAREMDSQETEYSLWEDGVTSILETIKHRGFAFGTAFTTSLVEACTGRQEIGDTLSVILASVLCEYTPQASTTECVHVILSLLQQSPGYVQEPLLVALVAILMRDEYLNDALIKSILESIKVAAATSKKPLQKRCDQVSQIITGNLLKEVKNATKSRTLIDVLKAMVDVLSAERKMQRSRSMSRTSSSRSPAIISPSTSPSSSSLRYDAYEAPRVPSRRTDRGSLEEEDGGDDEAMSRTMTAGDLALLADQRGDVRPVNALKLQTKGDLVDVRQQSPPANYTRSTSHRPRAAQPVPDPFGDSDPEE